MKQMAGIFRGRSFKNSEEDFSFRYPEDWILRQLITTQAPGLLEQWTLTNTQEEIRIDFQIFTNLYKAGLGNLFDCVANLCQEININNQEYFEIVTESPSGEVTLDLGTVKNNRIYKITAYTRGKGEGLEKVKMVFNTIKIN